MITTRGNFAEFLGGTISGVVTAVPHNVIDNSGWPLAEDAAKLTGVHRRRWAGVGQTVETLGLHAAQRLMANLGWHPSEIDALVLVTQTPASAIPSSAHRLHAALKLPVYCPAMEVNWSCAGYVQGLWLAMKLAQTDALHETKKVLLIVGDCLTATLDEADRATAPIFGDAVSATGVVNGPLSGLTYFVMGNDGIGADRLKLDTKPESTLYMDGASVFTFTLRNVPPLVDDVLENGEPDFLLFHQANEFMLDHLAKKMALSSRFSSSQIPKNVNLFGNTSSASIPLLLCDELGVTAARNSKLALFGYGAGWAWAGAYVDAHALQVAELVEN